MSDIKNVLFSLGKNKMPSPDGFGFLFYKKSWDIIGSDITKAILDFFNKGKLLKQLNHTSISLIPKTSNPTSIQHFRPISCCSTLYKTIAKVIARCLKLVLPDLVANNQGAFIPRRSIRHNSLLCQKLLNRYNRSSSSPRCAIKVDIRRAFDSINHSFILNALAAFGFPAKFVQWVRLCITIASFSININGSLEGCFKGRKGLRQDCLLSPYLFVIVIEYLSRLIKVKTRDPNFNFHPKCN